VFDNVRITIEEGARHQEEIPVSTGDPHWGRESDNAASIHRALAAIRREFDVEYVSIDGTLSTAPVQTYGLEGRLTD
jgi:hypothetical protein